MDASEARQFTAKDVRETADLSYRVLHVWESRGVLPEQDERGDG